MRRFRRFLPCAHPDVGTHRLTFIVVTLTRFVCPYFIGQPRAAREHERRSRNAADDVYAGERVR